jgi:hypothetical protein
MNTALEDLIEYVDDTFQDEELNEYIEMVNFVAGNIYKLNKSINLIEKERTTFGSISSESQLDLDKLRQSLTKEINRL